MHVVFSPLCNIPFLAHCRYVNVLFLFPKKGENVAYGKHDLNNHIWQVLKDILKENPIHSTQKQGYTFVLVVGCFHTGAREEQIALDVKSLLLCENGANKIKDVTVVYTSPPIVSSGETSRRKYRFKFKPDEQMVASWSLHSLY